MIHYISGKLAIKGEGYVVIETGGIGYEVKVPINSGAYLLNENDTIKIYTSMIVREDDVSIYGFMEKNSLDLFSKLLTVSGIGAKASMAILSAMHINEAIQAISFGDVKTLTKANGIGKKSAERIIVDLKDKLGSLSDDNADMSDFREIESKPDDPKNEAIQALIELGYIKSDAAAAVMRVKGEGLTVETYLKEALKII